MWVGSLIPVLFTTSEEAQTPAEQPWVYYGGFMEFAPTVSLPTPPPPPEPPATPLHKDRTGEIWLAMGYRKKSNYYVL